ncbi:MAG: Eco57I restriction-modification methylase domain-containing protein, partial [Anaerolineae bacterium]|nr:Eco57I restriction-modification methylase domain-containing protein [Anaerolineae bacterium]
MPAPDPVRHLVDHFHANLAAVKSGLYNETQARLEFINPLFAALGWDMDNRHKLPLDQREVIHEDAIRVGKSLKAPDYSFRVGGQRKFFVEAKQPSVKLDQAAAPAFQLRRYAWSASLPLSILTDFEEFAVYDCRYEPSQFDLPQVALVDYIKYTDYAARWDDIAGRFGYDAVRAGSLDRYAEAVKAKKGALTVDKAFLREIERWRDLLARNLALRNPGLSHAALNYAVQMTIDRLIFLRMAEDRAIEHYGRLKDAAATPNVYANLVFQFAQADARYNSGLFHFKPEAGREREDSLTLGLSIDDEPLRDIITHLYYPDSPYAFTVMPVEMLGQVYEQFLGKVISLTPDHRAVVEEKPEVRKAGGVYYTPAYIVDYIVRHTLGPLLEGKTPADFTPLATQDQGRKTKQTPIPPSSTRHSSLVTPPSLRVLDPACGSGSFLLGAYSYLLDWYRDQYAADGPAKHKTRLRQAAGGGWGLTLAERKRVLLDHIYGVDLDPQAVEVTKLSLLLKVLEGETAETLDPQTRLFHDRALPDLSANIQCGNSLIGPDFLAGRPYDPDEAARVNPFDWPSAFPAVFAGDNPGFDAVIGNPPYVRMELFKELKEYLRDHFQSHDERTDLYVYFMEHSIHLLRMGGMYGVIVSNKWVRSVYGSHLRAFIVENTAIERMIDFGELPVFEQAATMPVIVILKHMKSPIKYSFFYTPPFSKDIFQKLATRNLLLETAEDSYS